MTYKAYRCVATGERIEVLHDAVRYDKDGKPYIWGMQKHHWNDVGDVCEIYLEEVINMDIGSGNGYPAAALSNFAPHPFVFDGVQCNSMEGLLQAFKFKDIHMQLHICTLVGAGAKRRGARRNKRWRQMQTLWWQGKAYLRESDEYQMLLDRAYEALAANEGFRRALLATGNANLTHSIGSRNKQVTVLTQKEFCSRLMKLREQLRKEVNTP